MIKRIVIRLNRFCINFYKNFYSSIKVPLLSNSRIYSVSVNRIWDTNSNGKYSTIRNKEILIFGHKVHYADITWNRDYISGYDFPDERFDKITIKRFFNRGIDIKFPWELSRCYFFVAWGQNYRITKDYDYYIIFKNTLISWIRENPFLFGVNWHCTMEVAIRASNWIIACELFENEIRKDQDFENEISKSLQQHALYIDWFTENKKNNHEISNYAGLLLLSLSLAKHTKSAQWNDKAIKGLENSMQNQVFDDGVSYEYSTSYHRLVLEFFAVSAIACRSNGIELSLAYYKKLFRMFEFTAAYINAAGMEPQINDNDSGRFIVFNDTKGGDHFYLLSLGEHIYNYSFISQCKDPQPDLTCWLPDIHRKQDMHIEKRNTTESIAFDTSGFYFLKNRDSNLMINCNSIDEHSLVLHKHFDLGSFTLSHKDKMIIIDPGTYTYTRSLTKRNYFRSVRSHNTVIFSDPEMAQFSSSKSFFGGDFLFPDVRVLMFKGDHIIYQLNYHHRTIERSILLKENQIIIKDKGNGHIISILHINAAIEKCGSDFVANGIFLSTDCDSVNIRKIRWSTSYGVLAHNVTCLVQESSKCITTKIHLDA